MKLLTRLNSEEATVVKVLQYIALYMLPLTVISVSKAEISTSFFKQLMIHVIAGNIQHRYRKVSGCGASHLSILRGSLGDMDRLLYCPVNRHRSPRKMVKSFYPIADG